MLFSKASNVADSTYGKSQEPIKFYLEQQEEAFEKQSMIKHIFVMDKTKNFSEKYSYETSLGNFEPVGENGAYPKSSFQEGFSKVIEPDTWKNSFEVTQEMVEDAKIGKVKSKAHGFTLSYHRTRELFAAMFINKGHENSAKFGNKVFDMKCADGKPFFATEHPTATGKGKKQSNLISNVFSYDALCMAEEHMQNLRDDDGNLLHVSPDTIVIPNKAKLIRDVMDAIGADGIPGNNNNSFNYQFGRWNVIVNPYLTAEGTDLPWYLMDSQYNKAYQGLVWLDRIPLSVKSSIDENTDANVWRGRARYGAGANNWRCMVKGGITGATALTL